MNAKPTQASQILAHLRVFGSITPRDALDLYGCFRLAARIHELKADGQSIACDKSKGYARYTLLQPVQAELSLK